MISRNIKTYLFLFLFISCSFLSYSQTPTPTPPRGLIRARITIIESTESFGDALRTKVSQESTDGSGVQDFSVSMPSLINPEGNAIIQLTGLIGQDIWKMVIETIVKETKGSVVANPTIVMDNKETGRMSAINKEPYQTIRVTPYGTEYIAVEFLDIGITLEITPEINPDLSIKTKIAAKMSETLDREEVFIKGSNQVKVPTSSERSVTTTATLKPDECLILGGLSKDKRVEIENRVPFIATFLERTRIFSFLSFLFKNREDVTIRTKLYIVANISSIESSIDEDKNGLKSLEDKSKNFIEKKQ